MIEKFTNIFKEAQALSKDYNVLLCITTNGMVKSNCDLVMGAGIAKAAAIKYPFLPAKLGRLVIGKGNIPHKIPTNNPLLNIVSFPTKQDWKEKSRKSIIEFSMKCIIDYYNDYDKCKVLMTRPGCGLGGLDWENEVKPLLAQFNLNDDFIVCNI